LRVILLPKAANVSIDKIYEIEETIRQKQ